MRRCNGLLRLAAVARNRRQVALFASSFSSSFSTNETAVSTGRTVQQVKRDAIQQLTQRGAVPEPEASVHHLLAHALEDVDYETGFVQVRSSMLDHRIVTDEEYRFFQTLLHRRCHFLEPLQYIIGQWDFLDYTLAIQSPLLCPRPETEELVLRIVQDCQRETTIDTGNNANQSDSDIVRILDIGCGTGAIGIALADMIPNSRVTAIDIEPIAVQVSNQNAQRILKSTSSAYYEAILCSIDDYVSDTKFDIVVSNPPYIPRSDVMSLSEDVLNHESEDALCGGDDGLNVVRMILQRLPALLLPGSYCYMEVDPSHPKLLKDVLMSSSSSSSSSSLYSRVSLDDTWKDMFGKDRFVKFRLADDSM